MINGFEVSEAITAIQNWAMKDGNEDFDVSFVDSLSEKLEEYEVLSEKQESALTNIITRFEIDIPSHV